MYMYICISIYLCIGETFELPHFTPRGLRNLVLLDQLESLSPVLDLQCADLTGCVAVMQCDVVCCGVF